MQSYLITYDRGIRKACVIAGDTLSAIGKFNRWFRGQFPVRHELEKRGSYVDSIVAVETLIQ